MSSAASDRLADEIRRAIRDVPDFPKQGVVFKDVTPLLADARLFMEATEAMAAPFARAGITHVAAIESRGFILGGPIAQCIGAGFVPVRKPGKLPARTEVLEYQLEYGTDRLEIHSDACADSDAPRVLVVDDVLATGGTADATRRLLERLGAEVVGFSFLMALGFLSGLQRLGHPTVSALVTY